jgi:hypothetical protein
MTVLPDPTDEIRLEKDVTITSGSHARDPTAHSTASPFSMYWANFVDWTNQAPVFAMRCDNAISYSAS